MIASVHAFTQGSIGVLFLSFLALVMLTALGLVAWRWDALRSQGELDSVVSRESAFLLNNVLLMAAAFTVFFGTVFPLCPRRSAASRSASERRSSTRSTCPCSCPCSF